MKKRYALIRSVTAILFIVAVCCISFCIAPDIHAVEELELKSIVSENRIYVLTDLDISASASGGTGSYQYRMSCKNGGKWVVFRNYSSDPDAVFRPASPGVYTIRTLVRDSAGKTVYSDNTVNVLSWPKAVVNLSKVSAQTIEVNSELTVNASAVGGYPPYTYSFGWRNSDDGTERIGRFYYDKNAWMRFSYPGKYMIMVNAKDTKGQISQKVMIINVVNSQKGVLQNRSYISAGKVETGYPVMITPTARGGKPPYSYSISYSSGGSYNPLVFSVTRAVFKPEKAGIYNFRITVCDSAGISKTVMQTVIAEEKKIAALENNTTVSAEKLYLGKSLTMNFAAAGGLGGYLYSCYIYENGSWKCLRNYSTQTSYVYKPAAEGTYKLKSVVKDSKGTTVEKVSELNVMMQHKVIDNTSSPVRVIYGKAADIPALALDDGAKYTYTYKKTNASSWSTLYSSTAYSTIQFRPRENTPYLVKVKGYYEDASTEVTYRIVPYIHQDVYNELKLVNKEREKVGLDELELDTDLVFAAMIRAEEIGTKFGHIRPDESNYYSIFDEYGIEYTFWIGENIGKGYLDINEVMFGWMNSKLHKEKILSSNFYRIGIGFDGKNWTQLFAD